MSTPVNTSTYSFPASLTESKAPLKSPWNTLTIASLKYPKTSKAELNLSIRLSFIACPKAFKFSTGFSNISLKKLTTVPIFASINLNKSLNTIFNPVVAVANVSTTFWFDMKVSLRISNIALNAFIARLALNILFKLNIDLPAALAPSCIPLRPTPTVCRFFSASLAFTLISISISLAIICSF